MKRTGRLFDQIFTQENLYQAHLDARQAKRKTLSCFTFEKALGDNIACLLDEIHSGLYRPRPYFKFTVFEPKQRVIHAPAFRDRVVQHAIYRHIYPIFNRTFIDTSFACRVGYGTHKASHALQRLMRQCHPDDYYLQLDIRKFFYRIDRDILLTLLERKIKDGRLLNMMMLFAQDDAPVGIPIGNLLSQLYALIYLNPLDHFVKRELHARHYLRYVDDFVLLGYSRPECYGLRDEIEDFLERNLRLELSKSTVQKIGNGINFVGFRTWRNRRLVRKRCVYNLGRAIKRRHTEAIVSLLGHASGTQSMPHFASRLFAAKLPLPRGAVKLLNRGGNHALQV
jgi:retron-type reverse transcriptase